MRPVAEYGGAAFGEPSAAGERKPNPTKRKSIMGDKSPKSFQKQANQKQTKASDAVRQKQQAVTAKQLGNKSR